MIILLFVLIGLFILFFYEDREDERNLERERMEHERQMNNHPPKET